MSLFILENLKREESKALFLFPYLENNLITPRVVKVWRQRVKKPNMLLFQTEGYGDVLRRIYLRVAEELGHLPPGPPK